MQIFLPDENAIAYYRVSTDRQGRSGLGLDTQAEAVSRFIAQEGYTTPFPASSPRAGSKISARN